MLVNNPVQSLSQLTTRDHDLLTGLSDNDHTIYVLRSILTADGDIFIRSGGAVTRLAIGAEATGLKVVSGLPAWAAFPAFTELAGSENKVVTTAGTWEDWDISGIVPAGTKAALVGLWGYGSGTPLMGARKNGSALVRQESVPLSGIILMTTEVDANRVMEIYADTVTRRFEIKGYWS